MKKLEGKRTHRLCGRGSWGQLLYYVRFIVATCTHVHIPMCARGCVYRHLLQCLKHINRKFPVLYLEIIFLKISWIP